MPRVRLELCGGLEQLLPRGRHSPVDVAAPPHATVGSIIEDLGIPHTEIGSVSLNGRPRELTARPADGDLLVAHPPARHEASPAAAPRFILDVHLGRLARLLRLLGFDSTWSRDADDAELAARSGSEQLILLSRDRGLLKRREVLRGCLVRSQDPHHQLEQIVERYGLHERLAPFSRCLVCNAQLDRRGAVACPSCGRRYWRGSHWQRLNAIVEQTRAAAARRPRARL